MEGALGSVALFMSQAGPVLVRAHDDVPHGVASGHPTELHRAALGSGPAALGAGDVASQRGAEIPAHVPAAREHIQRITAGPEPDILAGEGGRAASGGCQEGEENGRKRSGHDGSPLAGDPSTPRVAIPFLW